MLGFREVYIFIRFLLCFCFVFCAFVFVEIGVLVGIFL